MRGSLNFFEGHFDLQERVRRQVRSAWYKRCQVIFFFFFLTAHCTVWKTSSIPHYHHSELTIIQFTRNISPEYCFTTSSVNRTSKPTLTSVPHIYQCCSHCNIIPEAAFKMLVMIETNNTRKLYIPHQNISIDRYRPRRLQSQCCYPRIVLDIDLASDTDPQIDRQHPAALIAKVMPAIGKRCHPRFECFSRARSAGAHGSKTISSAIAIKCCTGLQRIRLVVGDYIHYARFGSTRSNCHASA